MLLFGLRLDRRRESVDRILNMRQNITHDGRRYALFETLRHLLDLKGISHIVPDLRPLAHDFCSSLFFPRNFQICGEHVKHTYRLQ